MIYDLSSELQRKNFKTRCNQLVRQGCRVELSVKKGLRTISQNSYLHLILSYFASQYGERMEYVKQYIFKQHVNPNTFIAVKEDRVLGNVHVLRSSAELTTKEMTDSIERFRDWSAMEAGIYLPSPNEDALIGEAQQEVEKNKQYL